MSASPPPCIAVVLPPREGFGPRRARGIGLTVRHHALAIAHHRTVVFGGGQEGPVFLDVTSRLVRPPFFVPGSSRVRYFLGLISPLRRLRPALIEVHADASLATWLQSAFPAIPVTFVLYDDPAESRVLRTPARRALLLSRVARVATVSGWLRDRLIDGIDEPAHLPVVVPPAIAVSSLPATVSGLDLAGVPAAKRRSRVVLFVGRLTAEKGADLFVSACTSALPSLPGWRAEIIGASEHTIGSAETPFIRLLRAAAEPAGIGMMGYRDHPDVMVAMARAAIVVIAGRAPDPSGRVALEAMGNGAAVICCPGGALPEIGGDAVIVAGPSELAAVIRELGTDPRRLGVLGEAGRQRAMHFDLPEVGRLMETVRMQVIAAGPPRR